LANNDNSDVYLLETAVKLVIIIHSEVILWL